MALHFLMISKAVCPACKQDHSLGTSNDTNMVKPKSGSGQWAHPQAPVSYNNVYLVKVDPKTSEIQVLLKRS